MEDQEYRQRNEALGQLVQAASSFEMQLRSAFCALIGSKYAAIIAGGKMSSELISGAQAVAKKHREISEPGRARILRALDAAKQASERRNRLIHDVWVYGKDGPLLMRSRKGSNELPISPISTSEIDGTTLQLTRSAFELHEVLVQELGMQAATIEGDLRWEEEFASLSPEERTRIVRRVKDAAKKRAGDS